MTAHIVVNSRAVKFDLEKSQNCYDKQDFDNLQEDDTFILTF